MHRRLAVLGYLWRHVCEGTCCLLIYLYISLHILSRLKSEYGVFVKRLGQTGAGLDPDAVTEGSQMANLVGKCPCTTDPYRVAYNLCVISGDYF